MSDHSSSDRSLISVLRVMILAVHHSLLPRASHVGWTPYLWLFYLVSFYWYWIFTPIRVLEFTLTVLTTILFLVVYFNAHWHRGRRVLWNVAALVLMGVVWSPINPGAMAFFIYAAAFLGMAAPAKFAFRYLALIILIVALEWWLAGIHWTFLLFGGAVSAMVGSINIYYADIGRKNAQLKLSQEEVRQLAAMAERERIARDLHDLLGHTLSVITLKSELASKFIQRGDSRAQSEIRDVERISREALKEVREAVGGFRRTGLIGELANAKLACEAVGIQLRPDLGESALPMELESVLAMVLREAATNVVRHSGADSCTVSLAEEQDRYVLTVSDDGRGGAVEPGMGLSGMRHRLESVHGGLSVDGGNGTTVVAWTPRDLQDDDDRRDVTPSEAPA
jgi:two-component system, NarL family, sensor histidine kinase DesK